MLVAYGLEYAFWKCGCNVALDRNFHHDELPDLSCRRGKIESRDADNFSKSLEKSF
jgi:hypothetical protein